VGDVSGLALDGLSHRYGKRTALDGVSLTVSPGEVLCVLGPSGCGKTTLLRLIAGLETLQAGRVTIAGRVVAEPGRMLPPEARDVGLVFQDYALFPHLSVLENVAFGLRRLPRGERRPRALAVLEQVEMVSRASSFPHTLSGGEQQRVALARALAPRPAVMLLDEPFAGLDTGLRRQVQEQSLRLLKESGASVVLVTHDPEEAMAIGDRLAILRQGRLEQVGPPGELYARPVSAFVARFLGESNSLRGTVAGGFVATPLGPVPANGHPDGARVEVLVRPEAVRLERLDAQTDAPTVAVVAGVRRVGAQTVIDLRTQGGCGEQCTIRAVRPAPTNLGEGDRVRVSLDHRDSLVFAKAAELGGGQVYS
jgi:iron(III) transport system ATP-binding protein